MFVRELTLTNFRNYRHQRLELRPGSSVFIGDNAQGKSNLLEAVFVLSTTRSPRATVDADLINWDVRDAPQPVARLVATVERAGARLQLEMIVVGRQGQHGSMVASKRVRVNGVPRRQADAVGQLNAVLFTTDDMALITGSPAERRRYLDLMLSQVDRAYALALQRYTKVITQRNALLRRIQEGLSDAEELAFWDGELARDGATILRARAAAARRIAAEAGSAHRSLSGGVETLQLDYQPRFVGGWDGPRLEAAGQGEVQDAFRQGLESGRHRDIGAGLSLLGPHRDDLGVRLDGAAAASYASRGQQRTAALALRLAEVRFLRERTGEQPVLLLDDVLSELDEGRRRSVLSSFEVDQTLVTATDADRLGETFLRAAAAVYAVRAGSVEPWQE